MYLTIIGALLTFLNVAYVIVNMHAFLINQKDRKAILHASSLLWDVYDDVIDTVPDEAQHRARRLIEEAQDTLYRI